MKHKTLFISIITVILLMFSLTGCSNSNMLAENAKLKNEVYKLNQEVERLKESNAKLEENGGKDNKVYVIELEISQSHFSLSLTTHLKDSFNKLTIPIQVSKEYYDSVEIGQNLKSDLRVGSLIFKGSIGNWNIKVIDKQTAEKE